ncbi:hypothetical protein AB205_0217020, partial [Aquarana catesbeiana]
MVVLCDFYHDCDIMADTSDNFDTCLGPLALIQRSIKNALITVKMSLAAKGLTLGGSEGVKCVLVCVLTEGGRGLCREDNRLSVHTLYEQTICLFSPQRTGNCLGGAIGRRAPPSGHRAKRCYIRLFRLAVPFCCSTTAAAGWHVVKDQPLKLYCGRLVLLGESPSLYVGRADPQRSDSFQKYKIHSAASPEYGNTTCVRLFGSLFNIPIAHVP